jgi:hypothetical protein
MQLLIDLNEETPSSLRRISAMLLTLASEADATAHVRALPTVPAQPAGEVKPLVPPAPPAPVDTSAAEARAAFGGNAPTPPVIVRRNDKVVEGAQADLVPEKDSAGTPYDARIHAASKTQTKNGEWKALKGVDKIYFAKIRAEIRGEPAPGTAIPPMPPLPPAAIPPAPPPPAPPAPGATPAQASGFKELMAFVVPLLQAQKITREQIAAACATVGLATLQELGTKTEHIPAVRAYLEALQS